MNRGKRPRLQRDELANNWTDIPPNWKTLQLLNALKTQRPHPKYDNGSANVESVIC